MSYVRYGLGRYGVGPYVVTPQFQKQTDDQQETWTKRTDQVPETWVTYKRG